jgi:outer membrane protein TolC
MAGMSGTARAQKAHVTIEDCYDRARANWPVIGQLELIDRTEGYSLANAAKGWLPQVTFSAQASYQSDVTTLPFDPAQLGFAGVSIPTLSRDQYGVRVEVAQTLWDGGATGAWREGIGAAAEVERAATEVSLYALRERVNGLFFGIVLTGEQLSRLDVLTRDLDVNLARVEALARGGVAQQADVDALRIEVLKAAQQRAAIESTRRAYTSMLATLTGREFDDATRFVKPSAGHPHGESQRPELALFDARIRAVEARRRGLYAAVTPRLGLFATGGYGKPGLNMLADRFDAYYVVGARLSWNIGGLYTRRNDRRQLLSDVRGVELQREAFMLGTRMDEVRTSSEIDRCREQLRYDDEIIALRESVLRSSEARMAGGTTTGSDLARDINAVEAARQDKLLHEMELLKAIYELKFTTNR